MKCFFATKLNKWHLKRIKGRLSIDLSGWNTAHDFVEKNNIIIKKYQKFGKATYTKEIVPIK